MDKTLQKLNEAALKFLVPLPLEEMYSTIVKEAVKLASGEDGLILLEEESELRLVYGSSPLANNFKLRRKGYANRAFVENRAIIIQADKFKQLHPETGGAYKARSNKKRAKSSENLQSVIYLPVSYTRHPIGVLIVRSYKERNFNEEELSILNVLGSLATLAIKKAQFFAEMKKALELRDLFISMAVHELRTPLTTITGYVQRLHKSLSGQNTPEAKWSEQLLWESTRLATLIDELLEINNIKSGQLQYEWREVKLKEVINKALANFKNIHPNRTVILEDSLKENSDIFIGDSYKMQQVVVNLLENAAKFSSPHTPIFVALNYKTPAFVLSIKDEGVGIDKKDLPRIFEDFYKGSNSAKTEGMGLGLFLAKNIVARHQGSINVYSKVNAGTTVEVRLPKIQY